MSKVLLIHDVSIKIYHSFRGKNKLSRSMVPKMKMKMKMKSGTISLRCYPMSFACICLLNKQHALISLKTNQMMQPIHLKNKNNFPTNPLEEQE
jgi:hypothetical protein